MATAAHYCTTWIFHSVLNCFPVVELGTSACLVVRSHDKYRCVNFIPISNYFLEMGFRWNWVEEPKHFTALGTGGRMFPSGGEAVLLLDPH